MIFVEELVQRIHQYSSEMDLHCPHYIQVKYIVHENNCYCKIVTYYEFLPSNKQESTEEIHGGLITTTLMLIVGTLLLFGY